MAIQSNSLAMNRDAYSLIAQLDVQLDLEYLIGRMLCTQASEGTGGLQGAGAPQQSQRYPAQWA